MNREILFRGKRIDNGGWIEGSLVIRPYNRCDILPLTDYPMIGEEVNPDTVGQFTGLLDRNGKRIFEGDIVHFNTIHTRDKGGIKVDVNYSDGAFLPFHDQEYTQDEQGDWFERDKDGNIFEVIGTIHD